MSIKPVSEEIKRFVRSTEPEILCITGKWGVGKTYAWNYYLKQARQKMELAPRTYSYVSLFGLNSIDDLQSSLIENTVNREIAGDQPDVKSLEAVVAQLETKTNRLLRFLSRFPMIGGVVSGGNRALFLLMRERLICLDDIERAGSGLPVNAVLGMASLLKEEKQCKVVILMNQEKLSGENLDNFKTQLEKVADAVMTFEPTPEEAAQIGIDTRTSFHSWLSENTQKLGIVNVRIIRKAEAFCRRAANILAQHDPRILKQAVHTIALATYSKFQPEEAPPLELVRNYNRMHELTMSAIRKEESSDTAKNHKTTLAEYEWLSADEFDLVLIAAVETGIFDQKIILEKASARELVLNVGDKTDLFHRAWEKLHGSFDDNIEEVLSSVFEGTKASLNAIGAADLSQATLFLKEFGRNDQAHELIRLYTEGRQERAEFWDLQANPLRGYVADPDVANAFAKKLKETSFEAEDPAQILKRIAERSGWSQKDIVQLSKLSEDDYYDLFKKLSGTDLHIIVTTAIKFGQFSSEEKDLRKIGSAAEGALRKIASENPLNARRVSTYGVSLTEHTTE